MVLQRHSMALQAVPELPNLISFPFSVDVLNRRTVYLNKKNLNQDSQTFCSAQ